MARFLLAVFAPAEPGPYGPYSSEEEMHAAFERTAKFNEKLEQGGHMVLADGLLPVEHAATVDARGDEPVVNNGPYAAAKEHLGGFWIINAADQDEALRIAADGSAACGNVIEVRALASDAAE